MHTNSASAGLSKEPAFYDLVTIGSGSAARSAANEARKLGKTVAMVEHGTPGGTCLNVGCVPSKTLLAAAATRFSALQRKFAGVQTFADPVDLALLVADKDAMIGGFREAFHVKGPAQAGIDVFRGTAAFSSNSDLDFLQITVSSDGALERIRADQVVIASGATPFVPDIPGLGDVGFLTSASAMALTTLPTSMLVIGGNAIGLEQAQLFSRLGSKVTVVEVASRIAPFEDPAISAALLAALSKEGIEFHTGANLTKITPQSGHAVATLVVDGATHQVEAEKILVATGRRPMTHGLNLEAVGVTTGTRGQVLVDQNLRTSNPRIWAAGDVTGGPQFVYVAVEQGAIAARNALGKGLDTLDYAALPRVTFTSPEMASVGMTSAQAEASGIPHEVRELSVGFVLRAIVSRHGEGLIRLISSSTTGKILGVHMVAEAAGDVIAAAAYVLSAEMTVTQLAKLWSPEFTMTEALKNVAMSAPLP